MADIGFYTAGCIRVLLTRDPSPLGRSCYNVYIYISKYIYMCIHVHIYIYTSLGCSNGTKYHRSPDVEPKVMIRQAISGDCSIAS